MKKNYSSKLVFDYITGNEITGYNIDDLENDYEFMIQVIKHTKDKNMYNLCSKEVQTNYKFVKFMIETFKNDLKFICDVADNYLKTVPSESIDGIEIMIQAAEKIEYRKVLENPKLASFSLYAKTMSSVELYQVSNALDMLDDKELKEELGLGFAYIADKFENRETICNYFAKEYISQIFYEHSKYNLEELLHKNHKDFNEIKSQGIENYLIDYISQFDDYLAQYISEHINVLHDLKKDVERVGRNWNIYIDRINEEKVGIFNEKVSKYVEKHSENISETLLICYVIEKLGLNEIFIKHDKFFRECMPFSDEPNPIDIKDIFITEEDLSCIEVNDIKCIKFAQDLAKKLFESDIVGLNPNPKKEIKNVKSKILKFNSNKPNN